MPASRDMHRTSTVTVTASAAKPSVDPRKPTHPRPLRLGRFLWAREIIADYGLLQNLDTMAGRQVDNAGFFSVDDIDTLTDADPYDRLLSEFPDWLRAVRSAGIVPRRPTPTEVATSLG